MEPFTEIFIDKIELVVQFYTNVQSLQKMMKNIFEFRPLPKMVVF